MVPGYHSKCNQVTNLIAGRLMLTFIREVPGLKVSAKAKKRTSKHADHSSTLPPAYERIKAQLERRKKRQQRAQRPLPADQSGKKRQNVGGSGQEDLAVVQQSGGSSEEAQGSRKVDKRGEASTDREKTAALEQAHRRYREAKAAEKERQRLAKELEEAERDLQEALDECVRSANEGSGEDRDRSEHSQVRPGSQAAGSAQRTKVLSRREEHQERLELLASQKGSQTKRSSPPQEVSQRQERQERQEHVGSQKRSQMKDNSNPPQDSDTESDSQVHVPIGKEGPPSDDSSTESDSEKDIPMEPPHKTGPPSLEAITEPEREEVAPPIQSTQLSMGPGRKRVSQKFTFTSSFNVFISSPQHLSFEMTMMGSRNLDSQKKRRRPNLWPVPQVYFPVRVVHKGVGCLINIMLLDTWFLVTRRPSLLCLY